MNKKSIINNMKIRNLKVCICTLGKKENRYIREFVQFYEKLRIDKIFLYDNNDINDEKFEEVINDYVDKGLVEIFNWRGKIGSQFLILNNCYFRYNKTFDWLLFYDIDEYIHLKDYSNIKEFLKESKFNKCNKIFLNWVMHTDNNLIKYDKRTLHERFPYLEPNIKKKNYAVTGKSILRGGIKKLYISRTHTLDKNIESCNGFGKKIKIRGFHIKNIDFKYYYIDHYYSKSLEEFVEKLNKGDGHFKKDKNFIYHRIKRYFTVNKITLEKIEYIEKKVDVNLSLYRKKLYKLKINQKKGF